MRRKPGILALERLPPIGTRVGGARRIRIGERNGGVVMKKLSIALAGIALAAMVSGAALAQGRGGGGGGGGGGHRGGAAWGGGGPIWGGGVPWWGGGGSWASLAGGSPGGCAGCGC